MTELEPRTYGTHSFCRTKVAMLYKKTGNLRACPLLLGHRKLESTVRYLGIEVDDTLALSEQIEILPRWRTAWRTTPVRRADVVNARDESLVDLPPGPKSGDPNQDDPQDDYCHGHGAIDRFCHGNRFRAKLGHQGSGY